MKRRSVAFAVGIVLVSLMLGCQTTSPPTPVVPKVSDDSKATEWFDNGVAFFRQQRYAEAIAAWDNVLEAKPNQPIVYYNRGLAWYLSGAPRKAIDDFNHAIELNSDYHMAHYNRGFAWSALNMYAKALQDYQRVQEMAPGFVDAYYQSAWILAVCPDERYRNGEAAVDTIQKAIELDPAIGYYELLAAAYAEAGRFNDAVATQDMVIVWLKKEGKTEQLDRHMRRMQVYQQGGTLIAPTQTENAPPSMPTATDKQPSQPAPAPAEQPTMRSDEQPTVKCASDICEYPLSVHISSYRSAESATQEAQQLRAEGLPAFTSPVWLDNKGRWFRVLCGHFADLKLAQETALDLRQGQFDYARVMKLPYGLQVARSGSEQELDQLESYLATKGYLSYRLPDVNNGGIQRLIVGAFPSAQEATDWIVPLQELDLDAQAVRR